MFGGLELCFPGVGLGHRFLFLRLLRGQGGVLFGLDLREAVLLFLALGLNERLFLECFSFSGQTRGFSLRHFGGNTLFLLHPCGLRDRFLPGLLLAAGPGFGFRLEARLFQRLGGGLEFLRGWLRRDRHRSWCRWDDYHGRGKRRRRGSGHGDTCLVKQGLNLCLALFALLGGPQNLVLDAFDFLATHLFIARLLHLLLLDEIDE